VTPADLIQIARADWLDDAPDTVGAMPEDQYRFRTPFLLREIGNAQRQACYGQDLRHLYDETTPEICRITLVAGQASYPLDPRILRLHRVTTASGCSLEHTTQARAEAYGWPHHGRGRPSDAFYVVDRRLHLWTDPWRDLIGTHLHLAVWREPLGNPNLTDDLEWPSDQEKLLHWVAYRAFSRPDEDTANAKSAADHYALFCQAFGAPNAAQVRAELLAYPNALTIAPRRGRRDWSGDTDCHFWN
jgi:hypothetical protein